jgi:hypothetical protein
VIRERWGGGVEQDGGTGQEGTWPLTDSNKSKSLQHFLIGKDGLFPWGPYRKFQKGFQSPDAKASPPEPCGWGSMGEESLPREVLTNILL